MSHPRKPAPHGPDDDGPHVHVDFNDKSKMPITWVAAMFVALIPFIFWLSHVQSVAAQALNEVSALRDEKNREYSNLSSDVREARDGVLQIKAKLGIKEIEK